MQIMCSTFSCEEAENEEDVWSRTQRNRRHFGGYYLSCPVFDYSCICGISCFLAYLSMSEHDFMYDLTPSFVE